jgi:hypothetical protein
MAATNTHNLRGAINWRYPLGVVSGLLMEASAARIEVALLSLEKLQLLTSTS